MKAFQTFTPRVRRVVYDALIADLGCQAIAGSDFGASKAFERVCIIEHDASSPIFTQSDLVSYTVGPFNTGDAPPWGTPWAAWVASAGIRAGKLAVVVPPSNTLGQASSLFPTLNPPPKKVTIGFTSIGQMGLAIQLNETTIQIKWFKSAEGDYGTEAFPGISPLLFGNSLVAVSDEENQNDLVLYYIRPEIPRSLFARFERENFHVERLVHSNLPIELGRLLSTRAVGNKQELYALDLLGRDVTFYSPAYAVSSLGDKGTLATSINRGSYRQASVPVLVNTGNPATLSVSISGGMYSQVIVEPAAPLSGDAQTLSVAIEVGAYE